MRAMDRVSSLPDTVLTHVLSFLPTKSSIQTTLLATRFQNQWVSVPALTFHHSNSTSHFVNQALLLWGGAKNTQIHKFDIEFVTATRDVILWIRFAVEHSAKHLRLVFGNCSWDNVNTFFVLPQHVFVNSYLETLHLGCCVLSPKTRVQWSNIRELSINCVKLSNDLIKNLVSGSGRLEVFEIFNCRGYDSLAIDSLSLKTLKICNNYEFSNTPVTITAPNIKLLSIGGVWYRKITFVTLTSLVDAELLFAYRTQVVETVYGNYLHTNHTTYEYHVKDYTEKVVDKLHCPHSIEKLLIGTMLIEALTLAEVKTLPPQLPKCRILTVRTPTETNVLKGILNLVKMLPNLEVLILDMEFWDKWYPTESDVESFLKSEVEECRFLFQHLKTVKITSHVDRRPALPFIKFLLEHAPALKTMSIFPKTASSYSIDYMFQLIQSLSHMPRSSPIVKVLLGKGQTKIQVEINSCNFSVYDLPSEAFPSKKPRIPKGCIFS